MSKREIIVWTGIIGILLTIYPIWVALTYSSYFLVIPFLMFDCFAIWRISEILSSTPSTKVIDK